MEESMKCKECNSEYVYDDGINYICPECAAEWLIDGESEEILTFKDYNGAILENGDSVIVIKDLKINGTSGVVKKGTKVKSIRLSSEGDHDISCKIPGLGSMQLKSEFVKKVN
jgi:protein PhnA